MTTADLIAFLRARLDEDETVAHAAGNPYDRPVDGSNRWTADYVDPDEEPREDSAEVRDAAGGVVVYDEGAPTRQEAVHIARWDPARVLLEVEAKRKIIDRAAFFIGQSDEAPYDAERSHGIAMGFEMVLEFLALPCADHPDYQAEWKP